MPPTTVTVLHSYQLTRDDLSQRFFELSDRVAAYDWDMQTAQQYHRMMSEEMGREEAFLGEPPVSSTSAAFTRSPSTLPKPTQPGRAYG